MLPADIDSNTAAEATMGGPTVARIARADGSFDHALLHALHAVRRGDFSVRLTANQEGISGRIADAFNDVVAAHEGMAQQLGFAGQHVGREGKTRHQVKLALSGGTWAEMESTINTLIADLLWPTMAVTNSIAAVAREICCRRCGSMSMAGRCRASSYARRQSSTQ